MSQRIAILATGDELVNGDVINSNSAYIAQLCWQARLPLGMQMTVSDAETDMIQALEYLLSCHQVVITIGGLGPTSDDRTRDAVARVLKRSLYFSSTVWQQIERYRIKRHLPALPACNKQQAMLIDGASILPNANGTAVGQSIQANHQRLYLLPGPPAECLPMVQHHVMPRLLNDLTPSADYRQRWRLKGQSESLIASQLDPLVKHLPVYLGYRSHKPYLDIKLACQDAELFHSLCDKFNAVLQNKTG